jgi:uncharacterized membrane protein
MIIARPNQSSSWRANLLVLLALSVPSLGIAIAFAFAGAWPILPFAGLELLALGTALYYVNWKLQYYLPRQSWKFARRVTGLAVNPEQHPWEGPELTLHDKHESVSLGEFLNRDDSLKLLALLKQEIRVGSNGNRTRRNF